MARSLYVHVPWNSIYCGDFVCVIDKEEEDDASAGPVTVGQVTGFKHHHHGVRISDSQFVFPFLTLKPAI